MAARKKQERTARGERGSRTNSAASDEASIIDEADGERDSSSGELLVDEEKIRELGAVDAESVRENRRLNDVANKKRANMKGVPFNTNDPLVIYETLLKVWPANSIDIPVKRLTGPQVQHVITSRPRSGAELYEAIKTQVHGQYGEAEYEVRFIDAGRKEYRGTGRITMPDTRPQQQGGQHMSAPQYPYPYMQQPGYGPGYGQAPPGYPQQYAQGAPAQQPPPVHSQGQPQQAAPQQAQAQPEPQAAAPQPQQAPQQPPPIIMPPSGPDPMQMMGQMFQMFQEMRSSLQAQQPPQAPQQPQMPPPPPAHADPSTMMQWMQQMFQMFQQMQPPPQPQNPQGSSQQQPQQSNPMAAMFGMMGAPPIEPPPGTIWVPGFGFVPLERLAQLYGGGDDGGHRPAPRGPFRPRRPAYDPHGDDDDGRGRHPLYAPPQPPQPQKSAADQFRESVTVLRTAAEAMQELHSLVPQQQQQQQQYPQTQMHAAAPDDDDDDSPVRIIDTGAGRLVVNKADGTLRKWETGWANMDKLLNWAAEQREAIQRSSHPQQQQRQLPPGYVEVTEGYQPPPGMVAVPVHSPEPPSPPPRQHVLPPPPPEMPPPIQSTPSPSRKWAAPVLPDEGG